MYKGKSLTIRKEINQKSKNLKDNVSAVKTLKSKVKKSKENLQTFRFPLNRLERLISSVFDIIYCGMRDSMDILLNVKKYITFY